MGKGVPVNERILVWAREKAGFAIEDVAKHVDVSAEKFAAWESGNTLPTMNQLKTMAKFYHLPVITFFMSSPPIEKSCLTDFRTLGSHHTLSPSRFFFALKIKIEILHDTLKEIAEINGTEKKNYVGSISESTPIPKVVEKLSELLDWDENIRRASHTPRELFNELRDRALRAGILVVLKGDLGSHHSKVSAEEFRGICIADDVVPFVVINPYDNSDRAWIFTLIHELVHILLGDSGISNDLTESSVEREIFCNKTAGEFLVPSENILELAQRKNVDLAFINYLAEIFLVSKSVISRRLLDVHLINKDNFNRISKKLYEEWSEYQKKTEPSHKSGGPDPNKLARFRIGERVLNMIINASDDGLISYSQASAAIDIKPSRFRAVLS